MIIAKIRIEEAILNKIEHRELMLYLNTEVPDVNVGLDKNGNRKPIYSWLSEESKKTLNPIETHVALLGGILL